MFRSLDCPKCGGPLPPNARRRVVVCSYCGSSISYEVEVVHASLFIDSLLALDREPFAAPHHERLSINGLPYAIIGRLASGESSEVFLAQRARRVTERVVLKILRAKCDGDLLAREWDVLAQLQQTQVRGAAHFSQRVPQPVARGSIGEGGEQRDVLLFRYASGFVYTFDDVVSAYPQGLDARHAVWMWRRLLEVLGFIHESGFVHGAVLPQHILVHARDHGVSLVGFSCASKLGQVLPAVHWARRDFYPAELTNGAACSRVSDLCMAARSVAYVLGVRGQNSVHSAVPEAIASLLTSYSELRNVPTDDAWELKRLVGQAAFRAFGSPRFHHFEMPIG